MKVKIQRHAHLSNATIGTLEISILAETVGGFEKTLPVEHEPIYTLENPKRKTKVDDRIPAGTYECVPFSGKKYKNVYHIKNVPDRDYILLHWGNTELDTAGCILLGGRIGELRGLPAVLDSKKTFERFRKLIGKNSFTLEILD